MSEAPAHAAMLFCMSTILTSGGGNFSEQSAAGWPNKQLAVEILRPVLYRECDVEASLGSISEADAARWTLEFASASFGDPLLASAVALLLLPQMPQGVQVRWR